MAGEVLCIGATFSSWMEPICQYLKDDLLPNDPEAARKIQRDAAEYSLIGGLLFRTDFSTPIL
ncbi:hypothetical protein SESBI_31961 [Sesbania bispinosa]|nr:hypothetical protein SESBI_31961 [Sesbania bispinosa]